MKTTTAAADSTMFARQGRRLGLRLAIRGVLALALLASYAVRGQSDIKWEQPPAPAAPQRERRGLRPG